MTRYTPLIAAVALTALIAAPAAAQVALPELPVPLPDVPVVPTEVPGLPIEVPGLPVELPALELPPLLDPLSPILGPVTGIVDGLNSQIGGALSNVPLVNLLALAGDDAIDAAIAFSQATFETSNIAILARDDLFADSLTTGMLQGTLNAPLLLTGSGDLSPRTARELVRLRVTTLYILGAEDAIDPLVAQKLEIAGLEVIRLGGATRVETAVDTAAMSAPRATTAVLTRAYASAGMDDSQSFADLLSVGPWAAENDWPVLLTQTGTLTPSVEAYLRSSGIRELIIIGGPDAISPATEAAVQALGISTRRVAGSNRYATAVAVAGERGFTSSADTDRLILAEGTSSRSDVWAPGFAGAAHGANYRAPILLLEGDEIPAETLAFITAGLEQNLTDGGPAVVCASFASPIACQAAALLMIGDLSAALSLLNLPLTALPGLEDILALIESLTGLAIEIPDVTETVAGILEDPVGGVVDTVNDVVGTVNGVVVVITDTVGTVADTVDTATGGATAPVTDAVTGATGTVADTTTTTTGTVADTTAGATGSTGTTGTTGTVTDTAGTVTGTAGTATGTTAPAVPGV